MSKDLIKISLLAIAAGVFAVFVCKAQPYVLLTPIMSIIVGQTAQAFGNHKKTANRLIVLIILIFLVVLPYVDTHPKAFTKMRVGVDQKYNDLLKVVDRIKVSTEKKTSSPIPGRGNILESTNRGKSTK